MMSSTVSRDKYDYGWMKVGASGGSSGTIFGDARYFGPPYSMWFRVILPLVLILSAAVVTSCA